MSLREDLADLVGVAAGYTDAFGKPVETSLDARVGLLAALGFPVGDDTELAESLATVQALRRNLVPPLLPIEARRATRIPLRLPGGASTLVWRLVDERGAAREGRAAISASDPAFDLPPLTPGYHRLTVAVGDMRAESFVISAPQRCWRPRAYGEEGPSDWGLAAQLYGLRSSGNIGIGTYADAGEAAREAALRGAAFLGLSPVHALFGSDRTKISPYSPSSRLFLETLFIAPRDLPGLKGSRAETLLAEAAPAIAALREAALVDHAGVAAVLDPVLRALWAESPAKSGTDEAFDRFRIEGGEDLASHAIFEALSAHFKARVPIGWATGRRSTAAPGPRPCVPSPPTTRRRSAISRGCNTSPTRNSRPPAQGAQDAGMRLGLYRDLAVGADRGGSEIWSHPERFADRVSIARRRTCSPPRAELGPAARLRPAGNGA